MQSTNDNINNSAALQVITNEEKPTTALEEHPFITENSEQIENEQNKRKRFHPKQWLHGLRPNPKYPLFVKGDIDGFIVLFTNNLATLLVIIVNAQPILGDDIVYKRMVPGMGLAMLWGNFYYAYMARKLAYKEQRGDICAMPYGISTMGAFAFIYAIILPTYSHCRLTHGVTHCQELAYYVALASNFTVGIMLLIFCFIGEFIRRNTPSVALLSSISGLGFTYLVMNECLPILAKPIVSFAPFIIVMLGYLGDVSFGPLPIVFVALVIGSVLGWATSLNDVTQVRNAYRLVRGYPLIFPVKKMFRHMNEILPYLSTTIPSAIANAVLTIQCVTSAKRAGDFYPTQEALFVDGIGTLISSLFGSILSMTSYIGHPAIKKIGGRQGYSLVNGIVFIPICFLGVSAFIMSLITIVAINPIVIFVGLIICADTLAMTPRRHYPAFLLGLMPVIADWVLNTIVTGVSSGYTNFTISNVRFSPNVTSVLSTFSYRGLVNFAGGSLLQCVFITTILMYTTDRKFIRGAIWAILAGILSLFGIIHANSVGILIKSNDDGWKFTVAYTMIAVMFLIFHLAQRKKWVKAPVTEPDELPIDL